MANFNNCSFGKTQIVDTVKDHGSVTQNSAAGGGGG